MLTKPTYLNKMNESKMNSEHVAIRVLRWGENDEKSCLKNPFRIQFKDANGLPGIKR